jgi:hypothetical protein
MCFLAGCPVLRHFEADSRLSREGKDKFKTNIFSSLIWGTFSLDIPQNQCCRSDLTYHPDADPDSNFYLMRIRIFI